MAAAETKQVYSPKAPTGAEAEHPQKQSRFTLFRFVCVRDCFFEWIPGRMVVHAEGIWAATLFGHVNKSARSYIYIYII